MWKKFFLFLGVYYLTVQDKGQQKNNFLLKLPFCALIDGQQNLLRTELRHKLGPSSSDNKCNLINDVIRKWLILFSNNPSWLSQ